MFPLVQIQNLAQHADQTVTLQGWVYGKRTGGRIIFLLVRDGTGLCQCIVEAEQAEAFSAASSLGQESSLRVMGSVRVDQRSPGGFELAAERVEIVQVAEDYPISRKAHGVDFLLTHRHLWLRSQRQTKILRIRHTLVQAARAYFDDNDFTLIDTPILNSGAAEGAGTLFPVDYFGDTAYLSQTGQLYLESACMALGKVYCFGPTFRAEKSKTRRHLLEFWMIEPEIAFADLDTLMTHAEGLVCTMIETALARHEADLTELGRDLTPLRGVTRGFPRVTYSEAVDMLRSEETYERLQANLERDREELQTWVEQLNQLEKQRAEAQKKWKQEKLDGDLHDLRDRISERELDLQHRPEHIESARTFEWGRDFGGDEETILASHYQKPLFVTEYPKDAKAFYMKPSPDDPRVVLNLDLLAPEGYGEIIGGSVREDNFDLLNQRMMDDEMDPAPYEWYLDLRRYGSIPHGGFGLGIERTVAWICGLKHVRETIPFPRLLGRMYP